MDIVTLGLGERLVDYEQGWREQRAVHAQVTAGERPDTVLLVEHEPVFTAGKRTNASDRPTDGSPVIDIDRGGRITWHGPGQLVVYPIMRLAEPLDVVAYVRALEDAVIRCCAELDLAAVRVPGRTGVWFAADEARPARKVCAIGVRVARGVTMHGLALNCDTDLHDFERIVPCGISDAGVTSMTRELNQRFTVIDGARVLVPRLREALATVTRSDGDLDVHTGACPHAPGPGIGGVGRMDTARTGSGEVVHTAPVYQQPEPVLHRSLP